MAVGSRAKLDCKCTANQMNNHTTENDHEQADYNPIANRFLNPGHLVATTRGANRDTTGDKRDSDQHAKTKACNSLAKQVVVAHSKQNKPRQKDQPCNITRKSS